MHRSPSQPSKSADRAMEYLEIVSSAEAKQGFATRYDIYKKALNEAYTDFVIGWLKDRRLIKEEEEVGHYRLTENGKTYLDLYRKHRDLVGLFTTDLSGPRLRRS
jgi:hypothetical protein